MRLRVVETRVGRPRPLGDRGVSSAIVKSPVGPERLTLDGINLAGDDQADRSVHGGPDKSVYCYPSEHAADWQADGFAIEPGGVGENAVTAGARETDVRIGDTFRWTDAVVQISQPRAPCFKFQLLIGRKDAGPRMIATGRSGWYLRTIAPGEVDPHGAMELIERDDAAATVFETFAVMFPNLRTEAAEAEVVERVVRSAALAPEWLGYVLGRNPLAQR